MIKNKIFSMVALCSLLLLGTPSYSSISIPNTSDADKIISEKQSEQKTINSIEDFNELEKTMLDAIKLGDSSKYMALGSLYLEDYSFKTKDIEKAKFYFEKSLQEGYGLAALPLSYLSLEQQQLDDALLILDKGISVSEKDLNSQVIMAVFFNGLILDNKYEDVRYVHKALDLTYPISQKINKSALDFTVANLLQLAGNEEEAKQYLNTACNNPEIDAELKKSCDESEGITNNIKKSQECDTCSKIK